MRDAAARSAGPGPHLLRCRRHALAGRTNKPLDAYTYVSDPGIAADVPTPAKLFAGLPHHVGGTARGHAARHAQHSHRRAAAHARGRRRAAQWQQHQAGGVASGPGSLGGARGLLGAVGDAAVDVNRAALEVAGADSERAALGGRSMRRLASRPHAGLDATQAALAAEQLAAGAVAGTARAAAAAAAAAADEVAGAAGAAGAARRRVLASEAASELGPILGMVRAQPQVRMPVVLS